jgi:hypothetical protein
MPFLPSFDLTIVVEKFILGNVPKKVQGTRLFKISQYLLI